MSCVCVCVQRQQGQKANVSQDRVMCRYVSDDAISGAGGKGACCESCSQCTGGKSQGALLQWGMSNTLSECQHMQHNCRQCMQQIGIEYFPASHHHQPPGPSPSVPTLSERSCPCSVARMVAGILPPKGCGVVGRRQEGMPKMWWGWGRSR